MMEGEPEANAVSRTTQLRHAVDLLCELGEGWRLVVEANGQLALENDQGVVMYGGRLGLDSGQPTL